MKLYRVSTDNVNSILVVAKDMKQMLNWMDREHSGEEVIYARKLMDKVNVTDNGGVLWCEHTAPVGDAPGPYTAEDLKPGGTD